MQTAQEKNVAKKLFVLKRTKNLFPIENSDVGNDIGNDIGNGIGNVIVRDILNDVISDIVNDVGFWDHIRYRLRPFFLY